MVENTCFVYGTLMQRSKVAQLTHNANVGFTRAILHEYRRQPVNHAPYPAITPQAGGQVSGFLLTGLTKDDVKILDCYEGSDYLRQMVKVVLSEQENRSERFTWAYVWNAALSELRDEEWNVAALIGLSRSERGTSRFATPATSDRGPMAIARGDTTSTASSRGRGRARGQDGRRGRGGGRGQGVGRG